MKTSLYKIEIVPVDRGWILERMAHAIQTKSIEWRHRFDVKIVDQASDTADLTFFLPESAYTRLKNSISVTYLAHKETHKDAAALFEKVAKDSDYCITSSAKYKKILSQDGAKEVFEIPLGVDTQLFQPKLRLGVVGRTYHTGRKGESLLAELVDMPMVELYFTGEGWPKPAKFYAGEDLVHFYQEIDYLVIPSLIEGGPVPLLEALSSGCPVIAPSDIGLVKDFPHIPFERGNGRDLRRVIDSLLEHKTKLRESVLHCDWNHFAEKHLNLFAELIERKRKPIEIAPVIDNDFNLARVLLVTHGTEDAAKGGPSTRVRFIASQLQREGHHAEVKHNISLSDDLSTFDIVHIFNSWPPQTALESIRIAKQLGKIVIFSPIALDLAEWPIYRQFLESVFETGTTEEINTAIAQLPFLEFLEPNRRAYTEAEKIQICEGVTGHFKALRQCCSIADHIIFLSNHERKFLTAVGVKTQKGTLIHNGVEANFFGHVDKTAFQKKINANKYVLCVGRLEYRKNQALLAMAMRDINVPLILIGDIGDPGYLEHIYRLGGQNVFHFNRIENRDLLASAYAGASAFVLPSWCEGAPLAALEAGLTGAPLILSDRSSEREYFGSYAKYISPSDPDNIRQTILDTLRNRESPEERRERVSYLRKHYSASRHTSETLKLYRSLKKVCTTTQGDLLIDVSSLVHSLRVDKFLTGVPLVEKNLIAEIVATQPATRCITFNDSSNCFVEVDYKDLERFEEVYFDSQYIQPKESQYETNEYRLEYTPAAAAAPINLNSPLIKKQTVSRQLIKKAINGAYRLGISKNRIETSKQKAKKILSKSKSMLNALKRKFFNKKESNFSENIDFSDIGKIFRKRQISISELAIPPNSRILTLGQSWLSNEPLLNELINITAGHQLEAYVYDISYITGAHFSGWNDNIDRHRRLNKLLRHCKTVFTESRVSEQEIAKYATSRSFDLQIVRTSLRGKSINRKILKKTHLIDTPFVLYVSSFNRRKNHDFIINVWQDLVQDDPTGLFKKTKLIFAGEIQGERKYGDPQFLEQLKRLNIEIVTNADDKTIYSLYQDSLFTIYPSLQEGWGIPVQESLMSGKICIASNTVPSAIEINNAAIIKLDPNDFFGWRETIRTWTSNNLMRIAFEKKAAEYMPPNWRDIAHAILNRQSVRES